jgi:YVTN family beta-propeller protein
MPRIALRMNKEPIPESRGAPGKDPFDLAITPNGKVVEVVNQASDTVTPIFTGTNTAGKPVPVGSDPWAVAITPDGRTAYVVNNGSDTVTPVSAVTGRAGKAISVGSGPVSIAITP